MIVLCRMYVVVGSSSSSSYEDDDDMDVVVVGWVMPGAIFLLFVSPFSNY